MSVKLTKIWNFSFTGSAACYRHFRLVPSNTVICSIRENLYLGGSVASLAEASLSVASLSVMR